MATRAVRKTASAYPAGGYTHNFVPEFVQKVCAGANFKTKKAGRPFTMNIQVFRINTKEDGPVLQTYLMFGGVPSRKLHNLLEENGFKVRRRPRTWTAKDGTVVDIADQDRECYAVYYNTQPNISVDQMNVLNKIMASLNKSTEPGGQLPLLASWQRVEEVWGNREDWLDVCAVDTSAAKAAPAAIAEPDDEDETPGLLDDIDDLI